MAPSSRGTFVPLAQGLCRVLSPPSHSSVGALDALLWAGQL